mmetsp:Transcript_6300/g.19726  ORF Transcript_6300/g.19726 Transcript_6300/m.19726 type:complete len:330 (+) Transcript_6300:44-1033(+)
MFFSLRVLLLSAAGEGLLEAQLVSLLRAAGLEGEWSVRGVLGGGRNFCNEVLEVHVGESQKRLALKTYSDFSKARVPAAERGAWDQAAGEAGLGPRVLARSSDALLSEYVPGRPLRRGEDDALRVAAPLRKLHGLSQPKQGSSCALWRSIDTALSGAAPETAQRLFGASLAALRLQADTMRAAVEAALGPPDVRFGHGDLKPSNVLVSDDDRLLFLDFELAGPNYGLYDVAKLFRDDSDAILADRVLAFLRRYDAVSSEEASLANVALLTPVSWFEAAVFFLHVASQDEDPEWADLARDRFAHFRATAHHLSTSERESSRTRPPRRRRP